MAMLSFIVLLSDLFVQGAKSYGQHVQVWSAAYLLPLFVLTFMNTIMTIT